VNLPLTLRQRGAALLSEPLVHFLLAGMVVFILLSGRPADPGERRIKVDEAAVGHLAERWTQNYRRAPSPEEIDGLIGDYVKDQVYYREALRLGLDRDDEVVMRRMRTKMIATSTSEAEAASPTDAQLQTLLDRDPARYALDPQYTLAQLYLGADDAAVRATAAELLGRLRQGASPVGMGRPAPVPMRFSSAPASELAGIFGDEFAAALRTASTGGWTGPIGSGFGLHLVKIDARKVPAPPRIADVRQRLENDWRSAAIKRAEDETYRKLLEGYDVEIEQPR
jgi:peptidyl-prolyl cis-trans isomerase C